MVSTLYNVFAVYKDYTSDYPSFESYLANPVPSKYLNLSTILLGHWNGKGHYFHERYPLLRSNPDTFGFCILRDPFEVRLSLFRYEKKHLIAAGKKSPSFENHLKNRSNMLSQWMGFTGGDAVAFLSAYDFIATVENLEAGIPQLKNRMLAFCERFPAEPMRERAIHRIREGFPSRLPSLNTTNPTKEDVEICELKAQFEATNQLDLKLAHALKQLA